MEVDAYDVFAIIERHGTIAVFGRSANILFTYFCVGKTVLSENLTSGSSHRYKFEWRTLHIYCGSLQINWTDIQWNGIHRIRIIITPKLCLIASSSTFKLHKAVRSQNHNEIRFPATNETECIKIALRSVAKLIASITAVEAMRNVGSSPRDYIELVRTALVSVFSTMEPHRKCDSLHEQFSDQSTVIGDNR